MDRSSRFDLCYVMLRYVKALVRDNFVIPDLVNLSCWYMMQTIHGCYPVTSTVVTINNRELAN